MEIDVYDPAEDVRGHITSERLAAGNPISGVLTAGAVTRQLLQMPLRQVDHHAALAGKRYQRPRACVPQLQGDGRGERRGRVGRPPSHSLVLRDAVVLLDRVEVDPRHHSHIRKGMERKRKRLMMEHTRAEEAAPFPPTTAVGLGVRRIRGLWRRWGERKEEEGHWGFFCCHQGGTCPFVMMSLVLLRSAARIMLLRPGEQ